MLGAVLLALGLSMGALAQEKSRHHAPPPPPRWSHPAPRTVPEFDAGVVGLGLALLAGGALAVNGRRKKKAS